jgi:hypothetical protein
MQFTCWLVGAWTTTHGWHTPLVHAPPMQLCPHAPQSATVLEGSMHWPAQSRRPTEHWHALFTQCVPPVHLLPHPLQLLSSFVGSMQAPPHNG